MRGLYAITDPDLLPSEQLYSAAEAALESGIALLQYRDKTADATVRECRATRLQSLCQQYQTPLIINDDLTLANKLGCGVHLGTDDSDIATARQQLGPSAIIGASCYNRLEIAERAIQAGASYIAFGRFFSSSTKPLASAAQISTLSTAKQQLSPRFNGPIVAIGGITPDNGGNLLEAGADMLAVVAGLWQSDNISQQCARYRALFNS